MVKLFWVFVFSIFTFPVFSSDILDKISCQEYQWEANPKPTPFSPQDSLYPATFIKDYFVMELYDSPQFKNINYFINVTFLFKTYHRRIKLNNDAGVSAFNTMYIPVGQDEEVFEIHARAINPDGTIVVFDKSNLKYIENYEGYGPYKIFAFEGVQVGSEIEYFYTIKSLESDYYGSYKVQNEYPKKDLSFQIICPKNYNYHVKSYNGFPQLQLDSTWENKNRWIIEKQVLEAYDKEDFSAGEANLKRVEFKIKADTSSEETEMYSWKKAAKLYADYFYAINNPKEIAKENKAIKKLIKDNGFDLFKEDREKIIAVEAFMKEKIESKSNGGSFFVHQIVKSNSYTELAANRMFVLLMRELDIDHQIVLTCSRYDRVFDGDFESYTYLNNYLVYFPKYDQYAVPSYDFYRFGIVPTDLTYQKGLFIKTISVGGVVSSFPEIKEISGLNKSNNKDNLYVNVDIANDFSTINLKIKKEMMAYHSIAIQPYLPYLSIEKREENLNALFTDIGIGVKITNVVLENEKVEGYQIGKQFIVKADVEAESLLDKAGNKHLFKIGQVIGAQSELYQDKKRKYDVVNSNNRWYYREISLTIPEGYVISNLQDLNMDVYFENKGVKTLEFKSEYELSGNKLIVKVNEYYDQINIPKENYEQFRAVINAAADFNKKVLIFEKEKVK